MAPSRSVIGDLSAAEIESASTDVTEDAIDRTIEILRKQRRSFAQRPASEGAVVSLYADHVIQEKLDLWRDLRDEA